VLQNQNCDGTHIERKTPPISLDPQGTSIMTNQPNHDIAQQAHDLDDQQLEGVAGGSPADPIDAGTRQIDNGMNEVDSGMKAMDEAFKGGFFKK
jgi:hypothetical protein